MNSPIEQTVTPVTHDLGAFMVRRALPTRTRTMVGPFSFVDEFGPARLAPGEGMDVRPHPHINLATVTYLFDGAIEHRDSLGSCKAIDPGSINLATPRHVFWNFVSSSRERINQAKEDWQAMRFPLISGDDQEFIPLPAVPTTVSYP